MQYWELIDSFKKCALAEPNVNEFIAPDIYVLNSKPDIDYNVVAITPNNFSIYEDIIRYSINLYYITRWDESDINQIEGQSVGTLVLMNIINRFNELYPSVEISYPYTVTPFYEKFKDQTCGVFIRLEVSMDNDLGVCNGE